MGKSAGINYYGVSRIRGGMNFLSQLALMVGLEALYFCPVLGGARGDHFLYVRQGGGAVDIRLPLSQAVQVRAIEYNNLHFYSEIAA